MTWNKTRRGNKIYKNEIRGFKIVAYSIKKGFILKVNSESISSESVENIDNLISEVESIIEIISLDLDVIQLLKDKFAKKQSIAPIVSEDGLITIRFNHTNDERKIIVIINDDGESGYVASKVENQQSAITIAQELIDEYNEKGYYVRRHVSWTKKFLPHERDNEIVNTEINPEKEYYNSCRDFIMNAFNDNGICSLEDNESLCLSVDGEKIVITNNDSVFLNQNNNVLIIQEFSFDSIHLVDCNSISRVSLQRE